jgi:hypothetical protein
MKQILPLAAAALLLAACGGGGGGATTGQLDSGVRGQVLRGPLCPVATLDNPCPDEPYATDVRILTAAGEQVATTHSGGDGVFIVSLAPGHYILTTDQGSPVDVVVKAHAFTQATVEYDTGIR